MIQNKKIVVLGMARSGTAIAKFLANYNNTIIISDIKEQEESILKEMQEQNIRVVITSKQEDLIDETIDLIIKNPAIQKDHIALQKARDLNIPIINEMEASFSFLPKDVQIIGITGSNGKTTTTTLTYELLKYGQHRVFLGGNIGIPLASLVPEIKSKDLLVLEISDHQLLDLYDFKTHISVLTNLSPVHIDFHGTYDHYKETKKKIFNHHTGEDIAIVNAENQDVLHLIQDIPSKKIYFSSQNQADIYLKEDKIMYQGEEIISTKDILLQGNHNYENCMAAIVIAKQYGITNDQIKEFLSTFSGVEHRLEYVCTKNERSFYNDSKATNNESTIIALDSFKKDTILIMGGLDRNIPFDSLKEHLNHVTCILSYGETKHKIAALANECGISSIVVDTLEQATKKAYEISKEGDVILFSPACASWDQFKDFEERGRIFKEIVNEL